MHVNILFVLLTFIIVIGVIFLADNLTSAMVIVSLLANFLVISSQFGKLSTKMVSIKATPRKATDGKPGSVTDPYPHMYPYSEMETDTEDISEDTDDYVQQAHRANHAQNAHPRVYNYGIPDDIYPDIYADPTPRASAAPTIYGEKYDQWQRYNGNPEPVSVSGIDSGVDTANTIIAAKRARDKRCSDGWASKNSDYYKFHFGTELEETENKPWWGRTDI